MKTVKKSILTLLAAISPLLALAPVAAGGQHPDVFNGTPEHAVRVGRIDTRPLALVYRGPASCAGCSEAVAALLRSSRWNFEVRYVGPDEDLPLTSATLMGAAVYAQPGGDDDVDAVGALGREAIEAVHRYVYAGGRYLGFCMGGFLAGNPGFNLLDGDTDQYIIQPGATVTTTDAVVTPIRWRGKLRQMYFQNGNIIYFNSGAADITVLARYPNHNIAASVSPFGKGKVGIVGPHPEADASWYAEDGLTDPDGPDADLGRDLIDTTMGGAHGRRRDIDGMPTAP